jgi:hypothetical protein
MICLADVLSRLDVTCRPRLKRPASEKRILIVFSSAAAGVATVFPGARAAKDLSEPALACTTVLLARLSTTVGEVVGKGSFVRDRIFAFHSPVTLHST